jgi:hypothetical protein
MTIREMLAEVDPEILICDGLDSALVGWVERCSKHPVACYDYDKCVAALMATSSMTEEEATEYFEFNTTGAWVGERTPVFLHDLRGEVE